MEQRRDAALITITKHPDKTIVGSRILLWEDGSFYHDTSISPLFSEALVFYCLPLLLKKKTKSVQFYEEDDLIECFSEVFEAPPHLIIAGAGHVCEPVVKLAKMLSFFVTVVDDRGKFATNERFPDADEVICCDSFTSYFSSVPVKQKTYILLLTRGHRYDVLSLQAMLARKERAGYIGMIGSRRRIAGVFEQLTEEFPEETFDNIFTPVGLDIGAQTPEEISISIMAEILKVKTKSSGRPLSEQVRDMAKLGFQKR